MIDSPFENQLDKYSLAANRETEVISLIPFIVGKTNRAVDKATAEASPIPVAIRIRI